MPLLAASTVLPLLREFQVAMRTLHQVICNDLVRDYSESVRRLALPIEFFRQVAQTFPVEHFSHWRVVGWIETLNDLLYFIDLHRQCGRERDRQEFAEQLLGESDRTFYEHGYADELFPGGRAQPAGLDRRIDGLCRRLAREVTLESILFNPELACRWVKRAEPWTWDVPCVLGADFERAIPRFCLSIGSEGTSYHPPRAIQSVLARAGGRATVMVRSQGVTLRVGKEVCPVFESSGSARWHWRSQKELSVSDERCARFWIGPTVVYGARRVPVAVRPTPEKIAHRIERAIQTIQQTWSEGGELLRLLTSRIVPLRAKGVVSFSYRHRPGLSFINCFDRDHLDLIDDLIHENSHHQLNLLLRKYVLYQREHNQEIFYSPWRRSLRPLRGILHASFTFTMGAVLFERLSSWAAGRGGRARWKQAGLTRRDLQKARFRCLEEIESVLYSIHDLEYAGFHLKWLTASGRRLVAQLKQAIHEVDSHMAPYRKEVSRSNFGPALQRHMKELHQARQTYGPARLGKV